MVFMSSFHSVHATFDGFNGNEASINYSLSSVYGNLCRYHLFIFFSLAMKLS